MPTPAESTVPTRRTGTLNLQPRPQSSRKVDFACTELVYIGLEPKMLRVPMRFMTLHKTGLLVLNDFPSSQQAKCRLSRVSPLPQFDENRKRSTIRTHATNSTAESLQQVPMALLRSLGPGWFTVAKVTGAGRGLIALKDIPYGQEILRERPVLATPALDRITRKDQATTKGMKTNQDLVCYHCLGNLGSASHTHPVSMQQFCSETCMEEASTLYHEVEARAELSRFLSSCTSSSSRMPLMVARLACAMITQHVRKLSAGNNPNHLHQHGAQQQESGNAVTQATPASSSLHGTTKTNGKRIQGDVTKDMSFLCYANVGKPYPQAWLDDWTFLHDALDRACDWLARQIHAQSRVQSVSGQNASNAVQADEDAGSSSIATLKAGLMHGIDLDWYVSMLSRLHVNTFRVDTIIMPMNMFGSGRSMFGTDLASQAAAMVLAMEGSDSRSDQEQSQIVADQTGGTGSAAFIVGSLFNHSCEPNIDVVFPQNNATIAFRAARDISAGEQLTISYIDNTMPLDARQQKLHFAYGFKCQCTWCKEQSVEQSV